MYDFGLFVCAIKSPKLLKENFIGTQRLIADGEKEKFKVWKVLNFAGVT